MTMATMRTFYENSLFSILLREGDRIGVIARKYPPTDDDNGIVTVAYNPVAAPPEGHTGLFPSSSWMFVI